MNGPRRQVANEVFAWTVVCVSSARSDLKTAALPGVYNRFLLQCTSLPVLSTRHGWRHLFKAVRARGLLLASVNEKPICSIKKSKLFLLNMR